MKISKVFHFLYASLLALPLVAIASSCLVYAFNKEVETPRNEVNINYKYETNNINSIDDIVIGNIYTMKTDNLPYDVRIYVDAFYNLPLNVADSVNAIINKNANASFSFIRTTSNFNINGPSMNTIYVNNSVEYTFDVVFHELTNLDVIINDISICENIPIESVEVIEEENPVEKVFYRAVDYVEQSSLFKWSYDSFLYAPFGYITSLFSLPENNIVAFMMSYWLTISICWLCFDVVMYVPLLVHKWLDKGAID